MSRIDAFLGEQAYEDSRLSFGFDVANAYRANDESYIWLAKRLAQKANTLLISSDVEDAIAVSQINRDYTQYSHEAISQRLENKLDTPLTLRPLFWLQKATPRDIALFTVANRELHLEHQAALTRDQPWMSQVIMEGVEALVAADYYPKEATSIYQETLDHYGNWKAIDAFESGAKVLGGYCSARTIGIANLYKDPVSFTGVGRYQQQVTIHEASHGVNYHGGRGFQFKPTSSDRYEYFTFIEEAMAEHNAVVHEYAWSDNLDGIQMNIIEPTKRSDHGNGSQVYLSERTLCGVLELDPVELAAAQLSSIDTRKGRRLRSDLLMQMNETFGSEQNTFNFADSYQRAPSHQRSEFIDTRIDLVSKSPKKRGVVPKPPALPLWRRLFAS